jgi:hypothetical protein
MAANHLRGIVYAREKGTTLDLIELFRLRVNHDLVATWNRPVNIAASLTCHGLPPKMCA